MVSDYSGHDGVYRGRKRAGSAGWLAEESDYESRRLPRIDQALVQRYVAQGSRPLEIGCGTGNMTVCVRTVTRVPTEALEGYDPVSCVASGERLPAPPYFAPPESIVQEGNRRSELRQATDGSTRRCKGIHSKTAEGSI